MVARAKWTEAKSNLYITCCQALFGLGNSVAFCGQILALAASSCAVPSFQPLVFSLSWQFSFHGLHGAV